MTWGVMSKRSDAEARQGKEGRMKTPVEMDAGGATNLAIAVR